MSELAVLAVEGAMLLPLGVLRKLSRWNCMLTAPLPVTLPAKLNAPLLVMLLRESAWESSPECLAMELLRLASDDRVGSNLSTHKAQRGGGGPQASVNREVGEPSTVA